VSNLLGAAEVRALADQLNLKPTKKLGQNFVVDANTCRKIVKLATVEKSDIALEIGPGLGSLTLALLEEASQVIAIEIAPLPAPRSITLFASLLFSIEVRKPIARSTSNSVSGRGISTPSPTSRSKYLNGALPVMYWTGLPKSR